MKKIIGLSIAIIIMASGLFAFGNHFRGMNTPQGAQRAYMGDCYGQKHQPRGRFGRMHRRQEGMKYVLSQLDLSDKQIDKIDNFRNQFMEIKIEKTGKIRALQFKKRMEMKNHNYDKAKTINAKISELRKEISNARIDFRKNMWNTLTAEQKKKADKIIKSRPFSMPMFQQNEEEDESK